MDLEKFKEQCTKMMHETFTGKDVYKKMKVTPDDLLKEFETWLDKDYVKEYPEFEQNVRDDLAVEVHQEMIPKHFLQFALKKYSTEFINGTLYVLYLSEPFDYIVKLRADSEAFIKKVLVEKAEGKNVEGKIELLVQKGICNRDMTILYDTRRKTDTVDANGATVQGALKRSNNDGTPLPWPESANIATLVGMFEFVSGKDSNGKDVKEWIRVVATLGGEFGDKMINPKCPKCKEDSMFKICPSCGTEKPGFMAEAIMSSIGKAVTDASIQKDKNGNKVLSISKTKFDVTKDLSYMEKEILYQQMKKVFPREFFVSGSTMQKWYNLYDGGKKEIQNQHRDAICIYRGFVDDMKEGSKKLGKILTFADADMLANEKLTTWNPKIVWENNVEGRVRVESDVIVIGRVMYFKPKPNPDPRFANNFPFSIKSGGVIVMRNEKPVVKDVNTKDSVTVPAARVEEKPVAVEKKAEPTKTKAKADEPKKEKSDFEKELDELKNKMSQEPAASDPESDIDDFLRD